MKKWEYNLTLTSGPMTVSDSKIIIHTLEKMGNKGWEMCGALVDGYWLHHYFKRPLRARKKNRKAIVYGK